MTASRALILLNDWSLRVHYKHIGHVNPCRSQPSTNLTCFDMTRLAVHNKSSWAKMHRYMVVSCPARWNLSLPNAYLDIVLCNRGRALSCKVDCRHQWRHCSWKLLMRSHQTRLVTNGRRATLRQTPARSSFVGDLRRHWLRNYTRDVDHRPDGTQQQREFRKLTCTQGGGFLKCS